MCVSDRLWVWLVACGLWLVACDFGNGSGLWLWLWLWPVACGLWLVAVACGLWLVACGLWLVAVAVAVDGGRGGGCGLRHVARGLCLVRGAGG